ncbi:MAG: ABC transporter ATP-binding protein [Pseudomonadota bacterium]
MTALLEARGLSARVGQAVLVDAVSLSIAAGERVALIGPNGAGKSTLLDLLSGIRTPSSGQVLLEGRDLVELGRRQVAQQVAVVPQLEALPDDLRALEAVLMGRAPHQRGFSLPSDDDVSMARDALRELDLEGFETREVGTLSGGERQRVLIARALVQRPRLLLLDEPTSALDLGHALYIFHLVQRLSEQGVAVLSTVHDLNQAPLAATRVLILHRGKLVVDDSVEAAMQPERLRPWFEVDLVRGELAGRPVLVPA